MSDKKTTVLLRERFDHMGGHSGYDVLFKKLLNDHADSFSWHSVWKSDGAIKQPLKYVLRKTFPKTNGTPYYNLNSLQAELKALQKLYTLKPQVLHVAYLENNLGLGKYYHKFKDTKKVATVHQPPSWWRLGPARPDMVKVLDDLIVLDSVSKEYFSNFLPAERVHLIKHGVDTDFFKPSDNAQNTAEFKCVFAGQWLRDLDVLQNVISLLNDKLGPKEISFHLVYPQFSRYHHGPIFKIATYPNVHWYTGLNDHELLSLYQGMDIAFVPLLDCTANNAILEGMACGLPIVSTAVGGINDYVNSSFAYTSNDVNSLSEYIYDLVINRTKLSGQSAAARKHTVDNFHWDVITSQVFDIYTH